MSDLSTDQLDSVSEGIINVTAPNSRNAVVICDFESCRMQASGQLNIVAAAEGRMSLPRRAEIGLAPNVELHIAAGEPAPSPLCQLRRLGDLGHAQQIAIEPSRRSFFSARHRELYMVNIGERMAVHNNILHPV
jgi:hypothetical protein